MRLISCVLVFCAMMGGGYPQLDLSQFFSQQQPQQPDFAQQNLPQHGYYGNNQQLSPFFNNYNYQTQCMCSCDTCHDLNPCCAEFCSKCAPPSNPAYVLYPYPYIILAAQNPKEAPITQQHTTEAQTTTGATTSQATTKEATTQTTTTEATTTEATTTTEAAATEAATTEAATTETAIAEKLYNNYAPPSSGWWRRSKYSLGDNLLKELVYPTESRQDNSNIVLTAMRRTKTRWMPKYGIVPIPDQIAEKLLLRMRHVKVLHPEIDTIRRTNPMYP